jgi:hypothetical protein
LDAITQDPTAVGAAVILDSSAELVRERVMVVKRKLGVRTNVALLELAAKMPREVVVP